MLRTTICILSLLLLLQTGCRNSDVSGNPAPPADPASSIDAANASSHSQDDSNSDQGTQQQPSLELLAKENLEHWQNAAFGGQGDLKIDGSQLDLEVGYPMTGAVYQGALPSDQYRLTFQARRMIGSDFFATVTFPVKESHCSLVTGGWGGATVGLSNIDGLDASRNETKTFIGFDDEIWYQFEVEVKWPKIVCRVDNETVIDIDVEDREVAVRSDVANCKPFGFCTYETCGEIRDIQVTLLGN